MARIRQTTGRPGLKAREILREVRREAAGEVEQTWHIYDSQVHVLALAFRSKSSKPFKLFPLRSDSGLGFPITVLRIVRVSRASEFGDGRRTCKPGRFCARFDGSELERLPDSADSADGRLN